MISAWDFIGAVLVWLVGLAAIAQTGRKFDIKRARSLFLYVWHTLFSIAYLLYVSDQGGDALMYYRLSLDADLEFSVGTGAVRFITSFFSSVLGLSVFGAFLGFNIFGSIGLLAIDSSLQQATSGKGRWVRQASSLLVLLPSISFWSSAIGKDAIAFMASGLALWAAQDVRNRIWTFVLAVSSMMLVRPHMAAIMLLSIPLAASLQSRLPQAKRIAIALISLAAAYFVVPYALEYSGLTDGNDTASIEEYLALRQSYNQTGGGAVDISAMSLPMKLFTYLFRPLPFEAHSIASFAASIDNLVLIVLCGLGVRGYLKGRRPGPTVNASFLWIFSASAWLILAMTTANLGISMRQKWMFVPMVLYLLVAVIGRTRAVGNACSSGLQGTTRGGTHSPELKYR